MGVKAKGLKTIVITGASSGIGAALAIRYAGPGRVLALHGRDAARLEATARACREKGAEVEIFIGDTTDRAGMQAWLADFDSRHAVDLVFANAGISAGPGPLTLEDPAQARRVFDVNLMGVLNTIEPLIGVMAARGRGHIGIMSSLAGFRGFPGAPAYCASKAAVRLYGEALVGPLRATGVGVHVICPGFIKSPMTDRNPFPMPFLMSAERAAALIARGIERGRSRIAFPWPVWAGVRVLACLPEGIAQRLLRKSPAKPR